MAGMFDLDSDVEDELDRLEQEDAKTTAAQKNGHTNGHANGALTNGSNGKIVNGTNGHANGYAANGTAAPLAPINGHSAAGSTSSAAYFEEAAPRNMWWHHPSSNAWLRRSEAGASWSGWSAEQAERIEDAGTWTPWEKVLDDSDKPFYKWFAGAQTNAAFTEVDVHVLEGRGDQLAYVEEPDPLNVGDKGADITRGALLARSAAAAQLLAGDYGLQTGDRVLFFLPAGIEQIVWVEACKRLGVVYCCCNPSLPAEQIADRVAVLRAKLIVTCEHPEWSFAVHKALNLFVPVDEAVERASSSFGTPRIELERKWMHRVTVSLKEPPFALNEEPAGPTLLGTKVLILGYVHVPLNQVNMQAKEPPIRAETRVLDALVMAKAEPRTPADVAAIWASCGGPPRPVEANFPLFIIFTSGTTGKPKGVCHSHAYITGLVETMKVVFNANPKTDKMLTVGALGWITGQSYQIAAVLASGITSVLMRGTPTKPSRTRFVDVINKHGITIFKAGSAFLREVMSTQEAMDSVRASSMRSLKIATFCAEPVSEAVQAFGQNHVCQTYINSYWATEHGGIAWSRRYGDEMQPLKADAHSWPLPWVDADVYCYDEASKPSVVGGLWKARRAKTEERGDVVCTQPYPYMFRFVWGDVDNFGQPGWTGDRNTMLAKYWRRTQLSDGSGESWCYTQGDFAVRYEDNAYTFHGRSDEVLNVNGILFGTEHIEGALLRDKQLCVESPIGHIVVIGFPDKISGEVPMAFMTPGNPSKPPAARDFIRLFRLVEETVGTLNVKFLVVPALPQTFSGKFMRRLLTSITRDLPLGDLSTVANPECIPKIREEFDKWKRMNIPIN